MSHELESFLAELRAELKAAREERERREQMPQMLTLAMAAKELSVSVPTLKRMIKAQFVATVAYDGTERRYVPAAEIERIASSATVTKKKVRTSGGRPKAKKYSARAEAAGLKDALLNKRDLD